METHDVCNQFLFNAGLVEADKFYEKVQVDVHEDKQKVIRINGSARWLQRQNMGSINNKYS